MRIIKHGTVYEFDCENCGCKFVLTYKELAEDQQTTCPTVTYTCPDCGSNVYGSARYPVDVNYSNLEEA